MVRNFAASADGTGSHRKNLLLAFAMVGSVACMLFAAVGKGGATWAGLLAIIGNVLPRQPQMANCRSPLEPALSV
jgi:hypothetical protein